MRRLLVLFATLAVVGAGSASAAGSPPRNTDPPTISGKAIQGDKLTATTGTWTSTTPITFSFQWRRCDSNGGSCSNISGANAKVYTLTSADVGNTVRVRVRATNTAGSATATSVPTAVVASAPSSISLDVNRSIAVYGRSVSLSGSVENAEAGQSVTITERQMPPVSGIQPHAIATVRTTSDGSFSLTVRPAIHTLYRAAAGRLRSNTVSVNVRPRLRLRFIGHHRFSVRALAARSFVGKSGLVQRFSLRRHAWVSMRRIFFTRATHGTAATIVSRAVFRTRVHARIRVVMRRSQTAPGYLAGFSNRVIA